MNAYGRRTWLIAAVFCIPALLAVAFPSLYLRIYNGIPSPWQRWQDADPNLSARIEILHNYGRDALNNLKLVNGGAIIAILTFLGHMFSSEHLDLFAKKGFVDRMVVALAAYALGLILSVLSGFVWFSEMLRFPTRGSSYLLLVATYLEGASLLYFVAGTFFAALAFRFFAGSGRSIAKVESEAARTTL